METSGEGTTCRSSGGNLRSGHGLRENGNPVGESRGKKSSLGEKGLRENGNPVGEGLRENRSPEGEQGLRENGIPVGEGLRENRSPEIFTGRKRT